MLIPADFRIGVLLVGALLLIGAVLSGVFKIFGGGTTNVALRSARIAIGLIGLAAVVSSLVLSPRATPAPQSSPAAGVVVPNPPSGTSPGVGPATPDLALMAGSAFADCPAPSALASPPDGASASRKQMLAAQKATFAYDAATTAYTHCVDSAADRIIQQYRTYSPLSQLQAVRALDTKMHNTAVDQDQVLVDRFNRQLKVFNAKHRAYQGPLPAAQ